ncbi:MAG: SUMF1/EgtB/PvdO family nonheme iron enzyme [Deltaproteobacteria bacterium]|nr:SUMF1/EgtB/PvdO family nonheme iron enzyme [Deltaproteobacteria bacterium]MBW2533611.1 SUMF1/EgtB/PvdO family nonheme iron enzyme [Deltaproteobacteria bacterium]
MGIGRCSVSTKAGAVSDDHRNIASSFSDGVIQPVGSRASKGDGRWGHADLAGSVGEWTLDWSGSYVIPCHDCANLTLDPTQPVRIARGGSLHSLQTTYLRTASRVSGGRPVSRSAYGGFRCARSP